VEASRAGIAAALNARKVPTARRGSWSHDSTAIGGHPFRHHASLRFRQGPHGAQAAGMCY